MCTRAYTLSTHVTSRAPCPSSLPHHRYVSHSTARRCPLGQRVLTPPAFVDPSYFFSQAIQPFSCQLIHFVVLWRYSVTKRVFHLPYVSNLACGAPRNQFGLSCFWIPECKCVRGEAEGGRATRGRQHLSTHLVLAFARLVGDLLVSSGLQLGQQFGRRWPCSSRGCQLSRSNAAWISVMRASMGVRHAARGSPRKQFLNRAPNLPSI